MQFFFVKLSAELNQILKDFKSYDKNVKNRPICASLKLFIAK